MEQTDLMYQKLKECQGEYEKLKNRYLENLRSQVEEIRKRTKKFHLSASFILAALGALLLVLGYTEGWILVATGAFVYFYLTPERLSKMH